MIKFGLGEWLGLHEIAAEEFRALHNPAERAIEKAAMHLENAIKKKLTGKRTGRLYKVSKSGRLHQASAPGEPPAILFGMLRNSITHTPPIWDGENVSAEVGTNVVYASRLEYGGTDSRGVRILPRPYLAPTVLEEESRLEDILAEAVL